MELTTKQVCERIEKITGVYPAVIKHYQGRREGDFYDRDYLWENSIRSGTYLIDDNGNVTLKDN